MNETKTMTKKWEPSPTPGQKTQDYINQWAARKARAEQENNQNTEKNNERPR